MAPDEMLEGVMFQPSARYRILIVSYLDSILSAFFGKLIGGLRHEPFPWPE
jgi:hypothetical protein